MNNGLRTLALAAVLGLASPSAAADKGLVTDIEGDVSYRSSRDETKAKAFMKVREGDVFTIGPAGRVKVLYFESGRRESFRGPAVFSIGKQASEVRQGANPEVTTLPIGVPQKVAKTMALVDNAKLSQLGGVTLRSMQRTPRLSPGQQAQLEDARFTYRRLRGVTEENDITPELFLYAVLEEFGLSDEMRTLVSDMRRRQPGNRDVSLMADYLNRSAAAK